MKEWKIDYSEQSEADLDSIFEYVAYALQAPSAAKLQLTRIIENISDLSVMPNRFPVHDSDRGRS